MSPASLLCHWFNPSSQITSSSTMNILILNFAGLREEFKECSALTRPHERASAAESWKDLGNPGRAFFSNDAFSHDDSNCAPSLLSSYSCLNTYHVQWYTDLTARVNRSLDASPVSLTSIKLNVSNQTYQTHMSGYMAAINNVIIFGIVYARSDLYVSPRERCDL